MSDKVLAVQSLIQDLLMDLGSGGPYNTAEDPNNDDDVWTMLVEAGVNEQHDDERTYIIDGVEYEIVLRPKGSQSCA